jgi:uncharacterized protein YdhG (YjbR/CyaY superfamily)
MKAPKARATASRPVRSGVREVEHYLAHQPPEMRAALGRLRATIRAAAPKAEEVISYRMPAFRQNGLLVCYAGFKDHASLFVASATARRKFAPELKPFASGKGTFRFSPEKPLPVGLVRRIVQTRVAENEARARTRHKGPRLTARGSG